MEALPEVAINASCWPSLGSAFATVAPRSNILLEPKALFYSTIFKVDFGTTT